MSLYNALQYHKNQKNAKNTEIFLQNFFYNVENFQTM